MPRNFFIYLNDIDSALNEINSFSQEVKTYSNFLENKMALRAIERNLEIIGEAVKNIPENIRNCSPEIEWKKIAGLRDIIIHSYFNINYRILWDIIKNYLPKLGKEIRTLKIDLKEGKCS